MSDRLLLAIDTSTRSGGVALWRGDECVALSSWRSRRNHTAELVPAIGDVLKRAGFQAEELEAISVALGPGGFSSLRVGLSVAKGLAMPKDLPLVGMGTLELEAYPYAETTLPICSVLDVGRGEVASATFQTGAGGWCKLAEERVLSPEALVDSVPEGALVCGEGVHPHGDQLRDALGERAMVIEAHNPTARLWSLGILGGQRLRDGCAGPLAALQPLYLRSPSIGPPARPQTVQQ